MGDEEYNARAKVLTIRALEISGILGAKYCVVHPCNHYSPEENLELYNACNGMADGRIKVFFGPHSPYTASEELLIKVRELADEYGMGIHIHVSETQKEINDISAEKGLRPFEYLEKIGFLGPDVVAAHCVWLSDEEIEIIKKQAKNS